MVATEILVEVLLEVLADVAADIAGRMELEAQVKIRQPEELKVFNSLRLSVVLLVAIYY